MILRRHHNLLPAGSGWAVLLLVILGAGRAAALTVPELQKEIEAGGKFTIVDIRDTLEFTRSHIPGALNIPATLVPQKNLPPIGRVVVYDDGLGRRGDTVLSKAVAALNSKAGIHAEVLQGGYAAWESAGDLTTRGGGLKRETLNYITYVDLQNAAAPDTVLVDLRKMTPTVHKNAVKLSDLATEFPGRPVVSAPPAAEKSKASSPALIVLIDSGDGTAEIEARKLKASGVRRYAILAGGELTIQRQGRPGSARSLPPARTLPKP